MRNLLLMFTIIAFTMQAAPPLPRQATGTSSDSSDKTKAKADPENDKTAHLPAIHPSAIANVANDGKGGIANQNEQNSETLTRITGLPVVAIADKNKTCIDYLFDWGPWFFSLCLVGLGILGVKWAKKTFGEIEKQATRMKEQVDRMDIQAKDARDTAAANSVIATSTLAAIERQAQLMEQQTKILEAPFDQWVEIRSWMADKPVLKRLPLSVELVNQTNFPMVITGEIEVNNPAIIGSLRYLTGDEMFLAPHKPYTIDLGVGITDQQETADSLSFIITGEMRYTHKINKVEMFQPIEGVLQCFVMPGTDEWQTHYTSLRHMTPIKTESQRQGEQKAN